MHVVHHQFRSLQTYNFPISPCVDRVDWRAMSSIRQRIKCSHMLKFKYIGTRRVYIYNIIIIYWKSVATLARYPAYEYVCDLAGYQTHNRMRKHTNKTADHIMRYLPHENQKNEWNNEERKKKRNENRGVFSRAHRIRINIEVPHTGTVLGITNACIHSNRIHRWS